MNDHLKLTTDEAVHRIKKDYDADIMVYDKVHIEILKMSAVESSINRNRIPPLTGIL